MNFRILEMNMDIYIIPMLYYETIWEKMSSGKNDSRRLDVCMKGPVVGSDALQ